MDSVALWLDEEFNNEERIERRILRDKSNIMELSDKSFVQNYRLSKEAFMYVLNSIRDSLATPIRSTAIPIIIKLAATLSFLGQGGYQRQIGQGRHIGVAQQSMSSCIVEICSAIENILCPKHINFRMTDDEKKEAKRHFFLTAGIPGVIGVVDGTHIQMIRPSKQEHLFFNRKLKHSINAMVICDHKLFIRAVNGRYGGASHDLNVWRNSNERKLLMNNFEAGDKSSRILGDSGYPLEPWILTPFRMANESSLECHFNEKLSKARSIIERVFGILKGRFRCLLAARELHYAPEKVIKILNVCCALHNICLMHNVETPINIPTETENDTSSYTVDNHDVPEGNHFSNIAKIIRDQIKNNLMT